ncbi:hypothetical protein ACFWP7_25750 [Streptomyces sp. NPDC058470]|uniref:hypothetical protein n=1 Tax=Streptomyces sp. NPDC058470 TaxID=3346515 RepID=UPI0036683ABA
MTRSISRRLLLAGATATALLTLGVFSGSASASAAPATTASASATDSSSRTPAAAAQWMFYMDNTFTEYLLGIQSLGSNEVTLVRGPNTHSQALNDWIYLHAALRKNFTVVVRDWAGNPINNYNFASAQPIRYDSTNVTFRFTQVIVS